MQIKQVQLPQNSLVKDSFTTIDYADAYQIKFETNKNITVDEFVSAFYSASPKWVDSLFGLRNKIVKVFGLKTPDEKENPKNILKNKEIKVGTQLGFFKVFDRTENEVLLGEDDKHLDFRASLLLAKFSSDNFRFTMSTTVQFNNWLGKLYFVPVKPFHKMVVKSMMKNTLQQVLKPE